jgi:hypothetical protein
LEVVAKKVGRVSAVSYTPLLPMGTEEEVAVWERMDDVIMVR